MAKADLTAERLRELLHYDPDTGVFRRVKSTGGEVANAIAGFPRQYSHRTEWIIGVCYGEYRAHRLAWFYVHGEWPAGEVDHIDCDTLNNRIANLRVVTSTVNLQNRRSAYRNNKSGLLGVSPNRDRWSASIKTPDGKVHLGTYDTPEEAHAAYVEAKRRLHEGCTI